MSTPFTTAKSAVQTVSQHAIPTTVQPSWQASLSTAVRSTAQLLELLQLDPRQLPAETGLQPLFTEHSDNTDFELRVPRSFVARMKKNDWNDPLLRQVLPLSQELLQQPGFSRDPLNEQSYNPIPGLIHKYHGRVLLVISTGCAINCRYCFRRHFPYQDNNQGKAQWQQVLDYINGDSSINEVIFSGGDPLAANDKMLATLTAALAEIEHVTTLRVHSRLPVVIPERITRQCLDWLTGTRLRPVMVIHSNHANELDQSVLTALSTLKQAGVTVLNQTVLLRDINDSVDSLTALNERLFTAGALPYYLHLLDRVQGAWHFEVSEKKARELLRQLLVRLPGYLIPRLVREQAGERSKTPIPVC